MVLCKNSYDKQLKVQDMRTNIPQVIFIDETSDRIVSRTFTVKELQMQLVQARLINNVYTNCNPDKIPWQKKDNYINIKEQWRPCHKYDKYEASDCGRIRLKGMPNEILEQHEKNYPNTKINDLLQILKDTPDNATVGYLYVDTAEGAVDVHQMVADAWLKCDDDKPYQVHHISNDGYDNSPWNLIYLKKEEHDRYSSIDSVHKKTYNDEIKCYHAPLHYLYENGVIKADGTLLDESLITLDDGKLSSSGKLKNIKRFTFKNSQNNFVPWFLVANDC